MGTVTGPNSRSGSINLGATKSLVADVKAEVLRYLEQLYVNHAPEFIYFKTLYHVFERFLSGQADDASFSIEPPSSIQTSGKRCSTSRKTAPKGDPQDQRP
jgi:hypothetical protein